MPNSDSTTALGIFARHPVPGQVKTRLARHWGAERAAALYAAFVADTADKFRATADRRSLCYTPAAVEGDPPEQAEPAARARAYFSEVAGDQFDLWPQPDLPLGGRLEAFFRWAFAEGATRVVVIGSDSPTLPREYVEQAFIRLDAGSQRSEVRGQRADASDCVLGPATDGGYYLVGLRERLLPIFDGIEWGTAHVLAQTVARVRACGASLSLLPAWSDVDTEDDLRTLRSQLADARTAESTRTSAFLFSALEDYTDRAGLRRHGP